MPMLDNELGVCSWSLQRSLDPQGMRRLVGFAADLNISCVQLAIAPLLSLSSDQRDSSLAILAESGLKLSATMIGFAGEDYSSIASIHKTGGLLDDKLWPPREQDVLQAAELTARLNITMMSLHVGFIPPAGQPGYDSLLERVTTLAAPLAQQNITLLMETGQESASGLLMFLNDLNVRNFAVNFDPANMVLYGSGNPIEAVDTLGKHIRHVHVKDGVRSKHPGVEWGTEVPFGRGEVPPEEFADALQRIGYRGPLVIEREAGSERLSDIRQTLRILRGEDEPVAV